LPTFKKSERLKSYKIISSLFKGGKSFSAYPLRLVYSEHSLVVFGSSLADSQAHAGWSLVEKSTSLPTTNYQLPTTNDFPIQFALSVPKKNFKHAVDRNLLRRRIREAYRLQKDELYLALPNNQKQYSFMVLYTAKETLPYSEIEKGIRKMIRKFLVEVG
jgi:ribonuclease P protein component